MNRCPCQTAEPTRSVTLKFLREQLLYDIRNYAYVEADVLGEERQHAQHVLADIGEEGNIDRVSRILSLAHSAVVEMLYPYTKQEPVEEVIDDMLTAPESYTIEMRVPVSMSRTTLLHLEQLIHEYLSCRVLADWLSITNPEAAAQWMGKAEAVSEKINSVKHQRRHPLTRRISVF